MLEARGLRVDSSRDAPALDDIGMIVHPGEAVAVVGANGSGKTTLFRALAGLVPIRSGMVSLDGEAVTRLPVHRRVARGIVYAPERARILRGMSVRDNLLAGAWLRRDRAAVERDLYRLLTRFPFLRQKRKTLATHLAVGERQIVALCRALMSAPRVLLLDEPFLGLDADERSRVARIMQEVRAEGVAILLAVHDIPDASGVAGRVYALRAGRIIFAGSTAALATAQPWGEIYD